MQPLDSCDRGFESRRGHDVRLLCLVFLERCVGRGLCDKLITRPEKSYQVCVYVCVCVCMSI